MPVIQNIPIDTGTLPDWNTRLGFPSLKNMYVGGSGSLYVTAGLIALSKIPDIRDYKYTAYGGGAYLVVTKTAVIRVTLTGDQSFISNIPYSGQAVQIDQNLNNQIMIADGLKAYVYSETANTLTTLTQGVNNFPFINPVAVVVLNSFAIWLDGITGEWIPSAPDNALVYDPLQLNQIDSTLTKGIGLQTLEANLYIFGSTGIEKWQATIGSNLYLDPFQKDTNFRVDFGALSENSIINSINKIYFLSSKFLPMELTVTGWDYLPSKGWNPNQPQMHPGISRIISQYPDNKNAFGSFYSWRGNFFYHLTFADSGIAWVWCENSQKWAFSDDLIVASSEEQETVALSDAIYSLSLIPANKHRQLITKRLVNSKDMGTYRNMLNGVELKVVQGYSQPAGPSYIELTVSKDSIQWLNTIRQQMGLTGQRQNITKWITNLSFQNELTFKFDYYGDLEFTIEQLRANIT